MARGAVVSWWVVDDAVGTPREAALAAEVPRWLAAAWPFEERALRGGESHGLEAPANA